MNKGGAFDNVTVRFWHGGKFKHVATGELIYIGGQGKTYKVDPDEFSYFDFIDLAKKCADYGVIEGLYYLLPRQGLLEGLRKVADDGVVPEMVELVVKYRTIEMYVLHEKLEPNYVISPEPLSITQSEQQLPLLNANNPPKPKKLTPKRGPPAHVKPIAHPLDNSPKTNLATPLIPKEVAYSTFTGTINPKNPSPGDEEIEAGGGEDHSDKEHFSGDELQEADNNDEEYAVAKQRIRSCNSKLVQIAKQLEREACEGKLTSQKSFTKQPVATEPSQPEGGYASDYCNSEDDIETPLDSGDELETGRRDDFKAAVAKYAIMQGRDVFVSISNNRRRNMKRNKQLKSTWVSKEMLEVFKARPHWPAKDIIEAIRRAYKMVVKKGFAYKVKYYAHKMLHGSIQDHYWKVGRYIEALKVSSPRVICVDVAFLKTSLGGQILSTIGRDANKKMFPIAWAAIEGENINSWEWFFKHLQSCLELGDGSGLAIISDEHQAILNAISTVLPKAEHRHCARHIFAHWHKAYRGDELKIQFWKIARAYNMAGYNEAVEELANINADAKAAFKAYNLS
ncbi:hypothetical protein RDABS01_010772 [Bienertia sinuspersici]